MLTADIRVNGILVSYLYIVNEKMEDEKGRYRYRFERYEPDSEIVKGEVCHKREDGALVLIKKVIQKIDRSRRKHENQGTD